MNDVISFLKEGKFKSFIFGRLRDGRKTPPFVTSRLFALYGVRKGYFSLVEMVGLLLPGRFRPAKLQTKFWEFLNNEAKNEFTPFLVSNDSIMLYGRPFRVPLIEEGGGGYYYLATLLFEVIVFDQYKTADYLRAGAVVIDAGANIGTFSALVSHRAKNATVYAFEPSTAIFAILEKNMKDVTNISCYKIGLGDSVARKTMYGPTFEDSGFDAGGISEGEQADIITLDKFVAEKNIPRVDFIKIDTEGYEKQILNGARETIKKWKPVIAMSAYHHKGDEKILREIVLSVSRDYVCDLHNEYEADLICYPTQKN